MIIKSLSTIIKFHILLYDVFKSVDSYVYVDIVNINFRKVFDTLIHDLLFRKLESISFANSILKLFKSCLSRRSQTVKLGKCISQHMILIELFLWGNIFQKRYPYFCDRYSSLFWIFNKRNFSVYDLNAFQEMGVMARVKMCTYLWRNGILKKLIKQY